MKNCALCLLLLVALAGCSVNNHYRVVKKYPKQELLKDYNLMQNILEEQHPGIYWYLGKDSMDMYFERGRAMLQDSMTEPEFRRVLSYAISKLGCGHTSVRASKGFVRNSDSLRNRSFPLGFKIWKDTALVTYNMLPSTSPVKRGAIVTAIDGRPMQQVVDSLFQFLSTDGYNLTHKYQTLSNRGTFSSLYLSVFGYRPSFHVSFIDSSGSARSDSIPIYISRRDTTVRADSTRPPVPRYSRKERKKATLVSARSMRFDTSLSTAFMELNTFQKSGKLRRFFTSSFKKLHRSGTQNLVIDLRTNGGGNVTNSNLLTRYLAARPFKIADSLYTRSRGSRFGRYQKDNFSTWIFA
ncbi:MAG TPA: S41 family peptidase, partial [Flavisolibacter sp.]